MVVPIHVHKVQPVVIALDLVVDLKHGHVLDQVVDQQLPARLPMLRAHHHPHLEDVQLLQQVGIVIKQKQLRECFKLTMDVFQLEQPT